MRIVNSKRAFVLLAALSAGVSAQLVNSTILAILNTTQLSPATKFVELLTSKPEYQPILELLSQPGNHTLFVPSDEVWNQLEQQQNSTDANDNDSNSTTLEPGDPDESKVAAAAAAGHHLVSMAGKRVLRMPLHKRQEEQPSPEGDDDSNNNSTTEQEPNPFTQGPLANYTVEDVIRYHILNGTYLLNDLVENTTVISTLVDNSTLAINGSPLPLLVVRNITEPSNSTSDDGNSSSSSSGTGVLPLPTSSASEEPSSSATEEPSSSVTEEPSSSVTEEPSSSVTEEPSSSQQEPPSSTAAPEETSSEAPTISVSSSFVASPTSDEARPTEAQPSNNGFSWYPDSAIARLFKAAIKNAQQQQEQQPTVNYTVGNGIESANVTLFDIVASNGVIHVIDKVLVPPARSFETIQNVSEISSYDLFLQKASTFSQNLDHAPNITIFAPSNDALESIDINSMDNDTLTKFVASYIVQGDVIYSTNVTNSTTFNHTEDSPQSPSDQDQSSSVPVLQPTGSLEIFQRRQFNDDGGDQQEHKDQGFNVTAVTGQVLTLQAINQTDFSVNGSHVIRSNILMENGVLHVIDHVFDTAQSDGSNNGENGSNNPEPDLTE